MVIEKLDKLAHALGRCPAVLAGIPIEDGLPPAAGHIDSKIRFTQAGAS